MSVGMRKIAVTPVMAMSIAITTNVYGRRSASLTIHMVDYFLFESAFNAGRDCRRDNLGEAIGSGRNLRAGFFGWPLFGAAEPTFQAGRTVLLQQFARSFAIALLQGVDNRIMLASPLDEIRFG